MFFLGQYRHNVDDKGRLTVPARYRELLTEGAYITQGFDRNLMVLPAPDFEAMARKLRSESSLTNMDNRDLKRLLFSYAEKVQPDGNGRILLPAFLREQHQLNGEVVLVGVGDFFEIWSAAEWDRRIELLQDAEANANRFAALDLSTSQE